MALEQAKTIVEKTESEVSPSNKEYNFSHESEPPQEKPSQQKHNISISVNEQGTSPLPRASDYSIGLSPHKVDMDDDEKFQVSMAEFSLTQEISKPSADPTADEPQPMP